jgi:hypothetical protein
MVVGYQFFAGVGGVSSSCMLFGCVGHTCLCHSALHTLVICGAM